MYKHQYHDSNELPPNDVQQDGSPVWVYVFPSFHGGQHQTDSALTAIAYYKYGATPGSAHARQGQSYGLMSTDMDNAICQEYVYKFLKYAVHRQMAGEQFWIGFTQPQPWLAALFTNCDIPHNISFPRSWQRDLESYTKASAVDVVTTSGQTTDICC
jgi:hypothetical protein